MKLLDILTENKLDDAIKQVGGRVDTKVLTLLYDSDPSETKKYFNWMVKQMVRKTDYPDSIITKVKNFDLNLNKITPENIKSVEGISDKAKQNPKDINNYEISDIEALLDYVPNIKSRSDIKREGGDVIYEDDKWLVLSPLTQEASCQYGAGTKWCTAARVSNSYSEYTKQGILIYFIDKLRNEGNYYRMALHVDFGDNVDQRNVAWYDAKDSRIDPDVINLLPPSVSTTVDRYIRKAYDTRFIKVSYDDIYSSVVKALGGKKIRTQYGDLIIFVDDYTGTVYVMMSDKMKSNFPTIENWELFATPFWEGEKIIPFDFLVTLKNGDEIEDNITERFNPHSIEMMRNLKYPLESNPEFDKMCDTIIYQYGKIVVKFVLEFLDVNNIESPIKTWESNNSQSTYKFNYPPKKNGITDMFVRYVMRRQRRNLPATKKDFYKTVLGYKVPMSKLTPEKFNEIMVLMGENNKDITQEQIKLWHANDYYNPTLNKKININGHNSMFFAGITDSGILKRDGQFYSIGPNYDSWVKGNLSR